ncbi:Hypothetical_protein [Hexamita inflata]|uniref:Hypothetical_protein n=1 Tax=Hexamita inflata TaxID=28002 RepID=A0AA86QXM7_9EUKA|nr:Hypothetical protein HINF_LOCUS45556 [Hexamita inflata]CAI9961728.1 Hypothetical protein HINF_LOCUS49373 [Hexamita inflata]
MTYTDYNQCNQYCNEGICELSYNSFIRQDEYICNYYPDNSNYLWYFMIIPGVLVVLFVLQCCCCRDSEDEVDEQIRRVQEAPAQKHSKSVVPAQTTKASQPKNVQTQKTQVSRNVTGVAPEGQLITLPNGQVGIFIPVAQPSKTQVKPVQQPPQFYLPQPIYQQQMNQQHIPQPIYQPQLYQPQMQQQAPMYQQQQRYKMQDTMNEQTIEMPHIPQM